MKLRFAILAGMALLVVQCKQQGTKQKSAEPVVKQDVIWLFDGSSTDHFRDIKTDRFPEHGWVVEGDVLTVLGKTDEQPGGHDIITKELFSNFDLELEARLTEGANSGIKYFVSDSFPGNEGSFLGLEYQLIDNERHPDAKLGRDGNRKMGALYDLIPPPEDLTIHPPGEWNKVRIRVDGNKVEHWLNDEKVLEFDRKSQAFRELVSLSKYKDLENFGELDRGRILLQGHGNDVSFRAIKIRTW
jgi:hypothetical protein